MTTYIYSYNPHSASAKALADALGIKRIKHVGSKMVGTPMTQVINWGSSKVPQNVLDCSILNSPSRVAAVTNKLEFFKMTLEMDVTVAVPWTIDPEQVKVWLSEGKVVVARTKLTGHSGEGIVILEGVDTEIVEAPLYTLYVPKKDEYRVHCVRYLHEDQQEVEYHVFDVQRKARKLDVPNEEVDWRVRNLNGGFIYQRQDIDVPNVVTDVALKVFEQTGLDFGAVDIIYNDKQKKAYALEVNTAPGLTGTTLEKYVEMLEGLI